MQAVNITKVMRTCSVELVSFDLTRGNAAIYAKCRTVETVVNLKSVQSTTKRRPTSTMHKLQQCINCKNA